MDQDPSTGFQDTLVDQDASSPADQHMPGMDQDTPGDQDTSLTDCKTPVASQVTSPPTTTRVTKVMSSVISIVSDGSIVKVSLFQYVKMFTSH